MLQRLKELWQSDWIVINRKLVYLALLGFGLYTFYNWAYTKGLQDMYAYMLSKQSATDKSV